MPFAECLAFSLGSVDKNITDVRISFIQKPNIQTHTNYWNQPAHWG